MNTPDYEQTLAALQDLPTLIADIEINLTENTPTDTGQSRDKPASKPPMPIGPVSDMIDAWGIVTDWVNDWLHFANLTVPPKPTWEAVCAFLELHWPTMSESHPAARSFRTEINKQHRKLTYHLGNEVRTWRPLPGRWDCPHTGDDHPPTFLLEHGIERVIRCPHCGTRWTGELEYERLGLLLGCDLQVTADQAAVLAKVTRRTIRRWVALGMLPAKHDLQGKQWIDKRDLALVVTRNEEI